MKDIVVDEKTFNECQSLVFGAITVFIIGGLIVAVCIEPIIALLSQ